MRWSILILLLLSGVGKGCEEKIAYWTALTLGDHDKTIRQIVEVLNAQHPEVSAATPVRMMGFSPYWTTVGKATGYYSGGTKYTLTQAGRVLISQPEPKCSADSEKAAPSSYWPPPKSRRQRMMDHVDHSRPIDFYFCTPCHAFPKSGASYEIAVQYADQYKNRVKILSTERVWDFYDCEQVRAQDSFCQITQSIE